MISFTVIAKLCRHNFIESSCTFAHTLFATIIVMMNSIVAL